MDDRPLLFASARQPLLPDPCCPTPACLKPALMYTDSTLLVNERANAIGRFWAVWIVLSLCGVGSVVAAILVTVVAYTHGK